jgi:hypothetical protein
VTASGSIEVKFHFLLLNRWGKLNNERKILFPLVEPLGDNGTTRRNKI